MQVHFQWPNYGIGVKERKSLMFIAFFRRHGSLMDALLLVI
jgi:hypothetical protein